MTAHSQDNLSATRRAGSPELDRRFCVAPMMDWTDRHCRYFMRLISRDTFLYTEMVTAAAIIHGDRDRLIGFDPAEQPVALQLGGSDPQDLAMAASVGEQFGYSEINLNVGCPSDRVQSGRFGACLMAEPALVARCVEAMMKAVDLPVTVKCRIGIDDQDSESDLEKFILIVAAAGCRTFIVHARKAWLDGLSPKQNRDVPPLDYERVYRLKAAHPELEIIINGGIETIDETLSHLERVDGVMMGRAAYHNPYLLAGVQGRIFNSQSGSKSREDILSEFAEYASHQLLKGVRLHHLTRHILGLYHAEPGARAFRRTISEANIRPDASAEVFVECLESVINERIETMPVAAE